MEGSRRRHGGSDDGRENYAREQSRLDYRKGKGTRAHDRGEGYNSRAVADGRGERHHHRSPVDVDDKNRARSRGERHEVEGRHRRDERYQAR